MGFEIGFGRHMSTESEKKRKRELARKRPPWAKWYKEQRWKRLRIYLLGRNPLCKRCGSPSQVVDHVRPHKGDRQLFFAEWNLQCLCKRCHDSKTARKDSGFAKDGKDALMGRCDETGMPVDPDHPWNRG